MVEDTLYKNDYSLGFKVGADSNTAGTVQFINWDDLVQTGASKTSDEYAEMSTSTVYVYQPVGDRLASSTLSVSSLEVFNEIESLPIYVTLSNSPATGVSVVLTAVHDTDITAYTGTSYNKVADILITPSQLDFTTWADPLSFTIKPSGWTYSEPTTFRV